MITNHFTLIFLGFLFSKTLFVLWLKVRHIQHIKCHQQAMPSAFADTVTLKQHQRAAHYSIDKAYTQMFSTLFEAMIVLFFTLGGGIEGLMSFAKSVFHATILSNITMIIALVLLHHIAMLPLSWYQIFVIEARHGFNKMSPRLFVIDNIKTFLLSILIGCPVIGVILLLMQNAGDMWWLYAWLVWVGLSFVLMTIYPTLIAPLFNQFRPLDDKALQTRIEVLLQRCGFSSKGVFVMDNSRRSNHGNAYFTGLGKAKRIVFFDTLLSQLEPSEIEAVLAHELGHFKKNHVIKRLILSFLFTLLLFWLLEQLLHVNWFFHGLGVSTINHATGLTLFFLVMPVFIFIFTPLSSYQSRQHEFEADAYAVQTSQKQDLIRALVKLYRDNATTLTPDPLHSLFYDSHPPASLRIAAIQHEQR